MDDLIRDLNAGCRVLDLGAGGGSFGYVSTAADVFALDLDFPASAQDCRGRSLGNSQQLPFLDQVFDVVVCNHTLEHFEGPEKALGEIGRVVKPGGHLWIAVPDGFGFDDHLYRWLFEGGGHVNRFSLETLVQMVEMDSSLRAIRYKRLHTGFVYLNPPDPAKLRHYPRRARRLARIIPRFTLVWSSRRLNWLVRVLDRWFGCSLSLYGFGVVFESRGGELAAKPLEESLPEIPADRNVCMACGCGHPSSGLRPILKGRLIWRSYVCPLCGAKNFFAS